MSKTASDFHQLLEQYGSDITENGLFKGVVPHKGHVLYFHSKSGKKDYIETARKLSASLQETEFNHINIDALKRSVQRLVEWSTSQKKNLTKNWSHVVAGLHDHFTVPLTSSETVTSGEPVINRPESESPSVSTRAEPALGTVPTGGDDLRPSKRLRTDCDKCAQSRASVAKLTATVKGLKEIISELKTRNTPKHHLNQAIKRKCAVIVNLRNNLRSFKHRFKASNVTIARLRNKLRERSSEHQRNILIRRISQLKSDHMTSKSKLQSLIQDLRDTNCKLGEKIKTLELSHDDLTCQLDEATTDTQNDDKKLISAKRDRKTYSLPFRRAAYHCLVNQVPLDATSAVITGVVHELANADIDFTPDKSTISQFVYELGVISDLQVGEILVEQDQLTLAWDGTSLDGKHLNEVHVHTPLYPNRGFCMQIGLLPGGTSDDYFCHIQDCITDIVETYSKFTGDDEIRAQSSVVKHLKNTIGDRAAVNHCVVEKLQQNLDMKLLELKCNVHPLDGVARKCRDILKDVDNETGVRSNVYGNDCKAVNLIYGLTKMRFKQGKGDPSGFKQFMRQENIKPSVIVRYVGNRMHVIFHLAGIFFSMKEKLATYLQDFCNNTTGFRTALLKDVREERIVIQLQVLGLIGKLLSGPWMRLLYGNSECLSNLEAVPQIQRCLANMQVLQANPLTTFTAKKDVFDCVLSETDEVLQNLQAPPTSETARQQFAHIMSMICSGILEVLQRQLEPYLTGHLSNPTDEQLLQSKSTPTHNMFAERVLGMTDYHFHHAPNATVGFVDGKVKSKINKTLPWLTTKSSTEQNKIVEFSISRARQMRKLRVRREEEVRKQQDLRQHEKRQKRDKTNRKNIEKKLKLVLKKQASLSEEFGDVEPKKCDFVQSALTNSTCLQDHYIEHIWYDDNGEDTLYNGKVIKSKSRAQIPNLTIAYWKIGESEQEAQDFKLSIVEFLTDFITGDLALMQE